MPVAQSWQQSSTAQFGARWEPGGTVITVGGELDAANADQLAAFVQRSASRSQRMIVDLRGLEFIGTAGFSALHRINVVCSAAQTPWAMATSAAVSRLLRVCDPDGTLPVTSPADEPLLQSVTWAAGAARSTLAQLVPQSG